MKTLLNKIKAPPVLACLLGVLLLLGLTGFVQPATPAAALERFFAADELQADGFAETFLAQVPLTQLASLRQQIIEKLGDFVRVEGETSPYTVVFAKGNATAALALNEDGQIVSLRITPAPATSNRRSAESPVTPKAALERLFTSETLEDSWFNDAFLAQVLPSQIADRIAQWTDQYGAFAAVEGEQSPFTVRLTNATISAEISLDPTFRCRGSGIWE